MTTILGIDEAGRGSVIGPMCIGGVVIDEKDSAKLKALGVKDSKLLTPEQREALYPKIKKLAKDHVVLKVSAKQIDQMRKTTNLNRIEAQKMAEIIKAMNADKAYVDAPQVSTEKFKNILLALAENKTKIIAENHADLKYPVCSAAAILAKVERDRDVERIKKIVGFDFGVGYPHDQRSIDFVKKALKEKKHLEFLRHSWVTVSNLKNEKEQKTLKEYKRNK
ncbi:MAG: ribonuclease HII [Candidatus Aenigmatarchaeota archaeon]